MRAGLPATSPPLGRSAGSDARKPRAATRKSRLRTTYEADAGAQRFAVTRRVVVTGLGAGIADQYYRALAAGEEPPAELLVPHQPASVTDLVARILDIRGPRTTIMTACSSSATAVGYAADRIRLGHVEVALAGGAEGLC